MAQFRTDTQEFLRDSTTIFEVNQLARKDGSVIKEDNYLHVGQYTSKERLKTSGYETIFFNTFQYGVETEIWDQAVVGTASAVHNVDLNNVIMQVGGTTGDKITRQTKNVMRYIPGRQNELTFAIRLDTPTVGVRRRLGLFDDDNGIYFEDAGVLNGGLPDYVCVIRSKTTGSVVERRVSRADWNIDKLDGNGPSGIIADSTKQQVVSFDYEWYGAGNVTVSWTIDGLVFPIHRFYNANIIDAPWCSTPFLPIRLELECVATTGTGPHYLYQGSNSLIAEGGSSKKGATQNQISPIAGTTLTTANKWYPILSIRLKPADLNGVVLPTKFMVATIDNAIIFFKLVRNATLPAPVTLGAAGPQPWLDASDPDAFTQYQTYIDPAEITVPNSGISISSGIITPGTATLIEIDKEANSQLGRKSMGTVSETYTLMAAPAVGNKEAVASLTWIEQR